MTTPSAPGAPSPLVAALDRAATAHRTAAAELDVAMELAQDGAALTAETPAASRQEQDRTEGGGSVSVDLNAAEALAGFITASVAVWREIDRLEAEPDGYHPVRMSVELRKAERAAWERYRPFAGSAGEMP